MSDYVAEPVPHSIDSVAAAYMDRQFNAIQTAFMADFVLSKLSALPERGIPGSIIYLENNIDPAQNGFYGCVKNSQGEGEWKKLQLT